MRPVNKLLCMLIVSFSMYYPLNGQTLVPDSVNIKKEIQKKQEYFYDSLKYKADQKKLTKLIYDFLISPPRPYVDKKELAINYYTLHEGKVISEIKIKSLEVFGPNFNDTTRKAKSWVEKNANKIHTKSNLNTIKKLLLFKVGDFVDAELMYENERIIRSLPYIKDVKLILEQDSIYTGLVNVTVLTQDRFSFGVSGGVEGSSAAAFEVYNQNIFGVGHEISMRFVGNIKKEPYLGLETYYKINNIKGKFINISLGYLNTYRNEGFSFFLDKPFITPSIKWGYGLKASRMYLTDRITDNDPIEIDFPFDLSYYSAWLGNSIITTPNNTQLVLAAGLINQNYFNRPVPKPDDGQYFTNNTMYMAGITFSQRRYIQDQLVFSYGITEDIPEGFKNEIVYGYDANEFGDRHYAHLFMSNGNLLINKKGYLYLAGGIGGYIRNSRFQQGEINASLNFISKQINTKQQRHRLFTRLDYTLGIRRFDIENLDLRRDNHIRGFYSREAVGKQRLSLNLEYVNFLRRDFYKFNMAFFTFADIGVIGSNNEIIFTQDYYSGIGVGLRLHNENLVFKTFHLRLAFYPFHPDDENLIGFILDEQSKNRFYSFQPTAPHPFRFE